MRHLQALVVDSDDSQAFFVPVKLGGTYHIKAQRQTPPDFNRLARARASGVDDVCDPVVTTRMARPDPREQGSRASRAYKGFWASDAGLRHHPNNHFGDGWP